MRTLPLPRARSPGRRPAGVNTRSAPTPAITRPLMISSRPRVSRGTTLGWRAADGRRGGNVDAVRILGDHALRTETWRHHADRRGDQTKPARRVALRGAVEERRRDLVLEDVHQLIRLGRVAGFN